jgi:DNA-binding NarL/FixJ family response regulator
VAGPTRVLLVDDDQLFAQSVAEMLGSDERLEVVGIARDGGEAVELAASLQPDLVLMDIAMPGIDGVEATRRIGDRCPGARIVMLTASQGRSDEEASGEAGAIGYLRKDDLGNPHVADSLIALVDYT